MHSPSLIWRLVLAPKHRVQGGRQKKVATDIQRTFQRGLAFHQQGKLAEAEKLYKEALAYEPNYFEALHLLGVVALQTRRTEWGVELITKAIEINSTVASAHSNLATALSNLKRFDEALTRYDTAIALKPDYTDAHYNRGATLKELKRFDESVISYDKAIALKPNYAEAYNNRGNALKDLNRLEEALASYDKAIALKPDQADTHNNRGVALQGLKRFDEALISYDTAIMLKPDYAEAYYNRGVTLKELKRLDEAVTSYDKAIALKPDYAAAYKNRGNALKDLNRFDEALTSYGELIALKPDDAEAYNNRGVALESCKRFDEAITSYDTAIALKPDYTEAYWNQGVCHLLMGRFEQGWRQYEWRKKLDEPRGNRSFPKPVWLGKEDIADKTLFIHWEQGFGDTIQFCRYAKLVRARRASVAMSVQAPLYRLLKQMSPDIQIINQDEVPPAFDYHCPLMSLPLAFGTTLETIPFEQRYIFADEQLREAWRTRLPPRTKPRVGIVWSGNTTHKNDHNRSIYLATLKPLLSVDTHWISLQKEIRDSDSALLRDSQQIIFLGAELKDFADTAAVIELMDLVITIDTSIAHLAGAMGNPVWIFFPYNPDWRWLLDRNDSPWYPSARLFRQQQIGNWAGVIEDVKSELRTIAP